MKIHENKEENYNIFCHKIQIMRPKIGSVKYSSFELFLLGWVTDEERNNHWAALNLFDLVPFRGGVSTEVTGRIEHLNIGTQDNTHGQGGRMNMKNKEYVRANN